jgi:hypothetical protein
MGDTVLGLRDPQGLVRSLARRSAVAAVALLIAWSGLFLFVHEVGHLGQSDTSSCRFSLALATFSAGAPAAVVEWQAPLPQRLVFVPVVVRGFRGTSVLQQARSPPALA